MSLFRNLLASLMLVFLVSCAQLESITNPGGSTVSNDDISIDAEPTQEDVLNQFSDVAFPPETYLDLTKSVVVGSDEKLVWSNFTLTPD